MTGFLITWLIFSRYYLPTKEGYIRHYRHCRRENYKDCMANITRVLDTEVSDWAERFRENVLHVRKLVLGL